MAIRKISEFVAGTPTSDSKILFEQNEKGKSCSIGDAVNTCSLSYEEIMATNPEPDLSGKVASAEAVKSIGLRNRTGQFRINTVANSGKLITADTILDGTLPHGNVTLFWASSASSTSSHITTFYYDGNNLYVYSNVSQAINVRWLNFY